MNEQNKELNQELWAFWEYDLFPYFLSGKVHYMKDNMVYVKSYQSTLKPFAIVEGDKGRELHLLRGKIEDDMEKAKNTLFCQKRTAAVKSIQSICHIPLPSNLTKDSNINAK